MLDEQLVAELRGGGHVLLLRHAASDPAQRDRWPVDFADCTSQRNLSETGRAQARAIGEAVRVLRIPIGDVLSSPYCRALETARLAFGRAERLDDLALAAADDREHAAALRLRLSEAPPAGVNRVLVTHFPNIVGATALSPHEGEVLVFSPRGRDAPRLAGRMRPAAWTALVERLAGGR